MPFLTTVKTFNGLDIVLPTSDVAAYEALIESVNREFHPATYLEKLLAQNIAHGEWRLRRSVLIEAGIKLLGDTDPKKFKWVAQHARWLRKQIGKDTAQLVEMQTERQRDKRHGLHAVPKRRV